MKEKLKTLAALATPDGDRPGVGRVLVAGASALVIAVAGGVAVVAFGLLLAALLTIYLIATRVLGIELAIDPKAFYERFAAATRG